MGFVDKNDRRNDEDGGAGQGLSLDLDLRACAICRRELLPWQQVCPDDGGQAVPRTELAPPPDPLADRLAALTDEPLPDELLADEQGPDAGPRGGSEHERGQSPR